MLVDRRSAAGIQRGAREMVDITPTPTPGTTAGTYVLNVTAATSSGTQYNTQLTRTVK
jgi:hypothetical protein